MEDGGGVSTTTDSGGSGGWYRAENIDARGEDYGAQRLDVETRFRFLHERGYDSLKGHSRAVTKGIYCQKI